MTSSSDEIRAVLQGRGAKGEGAEIHRLGAAGSGFAGDDAALVASLRSGHPGAPAALYDRYAKHVQRVLMRVLGPDQELEDVLHEVFAQALSDVGRIEDPARLEGWLTSVSVFTARGVIRYRRRRRWLRFFAPEDVPERTTVDPHGAREALARTYALLDRLPSNERIAFALRFVDEMELVDVADACDVSLATIKRRLHKARRRFDLLAGRDPVLREWLEAGR